MSRNTLTDDFDWTPEQGEEGGLNIQQFVNKVRQHWLFIALSGLLGIAVAYIYLSSVTPSYKTTAKILIKEGDPGKPNAAKAGVDMLQNLGLSTGTSNVDNELEILKSFTIMHQAVLNLGLYVSLSGKEHQLRSQEFYGANSPYLLTPSITNAAQYAGLVGGNYRFSVNNRMVTIEEEETGKKYTGTLGSNLQLPGLNLQITRNNTVKTWDEETRHSIHFKNTAQVANDYQLAVLAEIANKQTSVINLALEGTVPARSRD